jgi:hypothetical protein
MPFNNPSVGGSGYEVETGKYYVKVIRLEDVPEGQYGPQVKWIFELASLDGVVLTDERGFNVEFWAWTSPKISTGGKKPSKAYTWGEALLPGVDLLALSGQDFGTMVVGKKALALVGPNDNQKTTILNMSPLPSQPKPKAAPKTATPPEEPPDDAELIEANAIEAEQAQTAAAPW